MNRAKGQVLYVYQAYRIDWGQVIAFAYDYIQSKREWMIYRKHNPWADSRDAQYKTFVMAEMSLYGISCAIGIPMYVLITAARYERRYFEKYGLGRVDYERLIVALDANKEEYPDE